MSAYTTTYGRRISGSIIQRVRERLERGEDVQMIQTEELRDAIPDHNDDLDEANEVISFVEELIDEAAIDIEGSYFGGGTVTVEPR